jgi:hypothetical protein
MMSTAEPASSPPGRSFLSPLAVDTERASLVMIALGFAASLPYFLVFDTISAWFRAAGLPLDVIGFCPRSAAARLHAPAVTPRAGGL